MIIGKEENIKNHIDNKTTIYYYIVNENRVVKVTYDRDLLGTRKDWLKTNDVDRVQLEEIIKNKKGEVEVMEEVIERLKLDAIQEGIQEGIQKGIQKGRKSLLENMLRKGLEVEEIKELTGVTKREIEQIKKEIGN